MLPNHQTLLVADLHLGKDNSFRAAGIPIPAGINASILSSLSLAIEQAGPRQVIILGDLIHDRHSIDTELIESFAAFASHHADVKMCLVRGNHDRHVDAFPEQWRLSVVTSMRIGDLELLHQTGRLESSDANHQIGGHWHPVVKVGRGADEMRLPCFVVQAQQMTLPAFGQFKGGMQQAHDSKKTFYPICEGLIWQDSARRI